MPTRYARGSCFTGIFMVLFHNPGLAALNYDVGIRKGIDIAVKHNPLTYLVAVTAKFKSLHVITHEIANQYFFIGAG